MTKYIKVNNDSIAKTVLIVETFSYAKFIADTYLTDCKFINNLIYTGYYNDELVTIMVGGIGISSIGIYSYELFNFYEVKNIVFIGLASSYTRDLNLNDIVLVNGSYSESTYAKTQNGCEENILYSNNNLNFYLKETAEELGVHLTLANIHSSDVLYKEYENFKKLYNDYGCLARDIGSFALFHNANVFNKKAASLLTICDNLVTQEKIVDEQIQDSLKNIIEVVLETVKKL